MGWLQRSAVESSVCLFALASCWSVPLSLWPWLLQPPSSTDDIRFYFFGLPRCTEVQRELSGNLPGLQVSLGLQRRPVAQSEQFWDLSFPSVQTATAGLSSLYCASQSKKSSLTVDIHSMCTVPLDKPRSRLSAGSHRGLKQTLGCFP